MYTYIHRTEKCLLESLLHEALNHCKCETEKAVGTHERSLLSLSPRDMAPMRMAVPIDPEERALLETIVEAGPFPPDSRTGSDRAKGETGNPSLASDVGKKTQLTDDKANASGDPSPDLVRSEKVRLPEPKSTTRVSDRSNAPSATSFWSPPAS